MKERTITITLSEIYKDIDSWTYKYAEVSDVPRPSVKNHMQSDKDEALDGRLLARSVQYRDAKLRNVIGRYLKGETVLSVTNAMPTAETIVYNLTLDDEFEDSLLLPLCTMIARYLTFGALFDWYGPGMGSRQAQNYEQELTDLEIELINDLQAVTIVQKTKQPWGRKVEYGI